MVGAVLGTAIIVAIASGVDGFDLGTRPGESNLAVDGWANFSQPWLFWVAPLIGAALAGFVHSRVVEGRADTVEGYG